MEKNNSFWLKSFKINSFEKLKQDIEVDVCIVGGGITGITTAYYLNKQGYKVALLERDTLCSKTSGHTTAKITSQHGLFYSYLLKSQGEKFAKQYLEANENAISNIRNIINTEQIECDLENKDSFVFTEDINEIDKIREEVEVVRKLGIVDCDFVENLDINLNIKGAVKFKNQAQFNPIKYVNGLINAMNNNCQIFENTAFKEYEEIDDGFIVYTNTKGKIKTKYLVLATRYPIINFPGYYFLKMYQEMSYVIAIKPKNKFNINGMYINSKSPKLSIKTAQYNGEDIVLVGGYGNKTRRRYRFNT